MVCNRFHKKLSIQLWTIFFPLKQPKPFTPNKSYKILKLKFLWFCPCTVATTTEAIWNFKHINSMEWALLEKLTTTLLSQKSLYFVDPEGPLPSSQIVTKNCTEILYPINSLLRPFNEMHWKQLKLIPYNRVWEQGVDKNIWTSEGGSDTRLEKTVC
jgi:hypothetical protein